MRFQTLFISILLSISTIPSFAQNEDIVVTTQTDSRIFRVSIESSDASDKSLLEKAFGAHGAYKVVTANQSEFHFQFTRKSDSAVECAILSGRPARELKRFVENGNSARNSLLRAADRAVRLTSGEEGFFASRLVFIGERGGNYREVYTSDFFFDEIRYHTADKSQSVNPRWAPDGSKIIYTGYFGSGFPDIFVIDPVTSRRSQFASYKGTNSGARFSPNGSAVAMVLSAPGNSELFISSSAGGGAKRLTRNDSIEASPSWKRDGSELVFTSDTAGKPQLYTISTEGGKMKRIATQISNYCAEPDWNPVDSNKIVFTAVFREGFQIVLWDFKLNKSIILTRGARDSIEPAWLNDGRHIVFTRRVGTSKQLMVIDSVTRQETAISSKRFGSASQANAIYLR
jgi:TolB protein